MAEKVGFEPTVLCSTPHFESRGFYKEVIYNMTYRVANIVLCC